MPKFILDGSSKPEFRDLPEFVQGYIECIFFTNTSSIPMATFWTDESQERIREGQADGDLPCDSGFIELHPDALAAIIADCAAFQTESADLLSAAYETGKYDATQAGRDFWFTRCGHGVGYWDREAIDYRSVASGRDEDSIGGKLSLIARHAGEPHVWFGDHVTYGNEPFVHYY